MKDNHDEIHKIHDRQLTWGFRALAFVGFFAVAISLSRAFVVGWQNIMALHIGLYLVIVVTAILDQYLSFLIRAWILIGIVFIQGVAGLISWGLTGFGTISLIMCCILCTIGFGKQAELLLPQ
jgi:hypothetical protein